MGGFPFDISNLTENMPTTQATAEDRAVECGMSKMDGQILFRQNGIDKGHWYSQEEVGCYARGPTPSDVDKPLFTGIRDKLSGWFQDATQAASSVSVPTNLQELKQSVDTGSTAGIIRDTNNSIQQRADQIVSQIPGRGR